MKHLIFLGAPGSGKGTQSNRLISSKGYKHVSTGDLLRSEISKDTELGKEVKQVMDKGGLVSDDLVVRLLKANIDLRNGNYIFDGYPRNIIQAKTLDNEVIQDYPSLAIYFDIDLDMLSERLTNRRTCRNCGEIFNLITKPPKINGVCDKCGSSELAQRVDDQEDVIKSRLRVFKETIDPVISYYQDLNRLARISAELEEDRIFAEILSKL
jgi:adenylate kinase